MESVARITLAYIRGVKYIGRHELDAKVQVICTELDVAVEDVDDVVDNINVNYLKLLGFKIDKTLDEISMELQYAFVNTDEIVMDANKELTGFKPHEIEIIKHIIDIIFTNNYFEQLTKVFNALVLEYKINRSSKELKALVTRLINLGYFQLANDNLICTPRLLLELKNHITKFDLASCGVCNNVVTRGVKVDTASFHHKCFEIHSRSHNVDSYITTIGLEVPS